MMYARTTNSKCEQKTARKRLMVVDPAKPEKVRQKIMFKFVNKRAF